MIINSGSGRGGVQLRRGNELHGKVIKFLTASAAALAAATPDDWQQATYWNRLDLAEVCCAPDSRLTEEIRNKGGTAERFAEWNGFNLSKKSDTYELIEQLRVHHPRHILVTPPAAQEATEATLSPVERAAVEHVALTQTDTLHSWPSMDIISS